MKCGEQEFTKNLNQLSEMKEQQYVHVKAIKLKYREGVTLDVTFEDGLVKRYDMAQAYASYPPLRVLEDRSLFVSGELNPYGIIWNDDLDISTTVIYDEGITIRKVKPYRNVDVGDAVGLARATREISQETLAARVGMDQSDISKIERGVANPSVNTLRKIADALDCNLEVRFEPKDPNDPAFYPPDDGQ